MSRLYPAALLAVSVLAVLEDRTAHVTRLEKIDKQEDTGDTCSSESNPGDVVTIAEWPYLDMGPTATHFYRLLSR